MKLALHLLLFQLGWFASVLGAARGHPYVGPLSVGLAYLIHWKWLATKREGLLVLASAAIGAVSESILGAAGILTYQADPGPAWLCPPWIVAMWANFGMALRHSLRWLEGRWALAALLGGVFGPLAYEAGARLGAIEMPERALALTALAILWGLAIPILLRLSECLKENID